VLVTFAVGFCANTAKLAFDSIVQRDAPDANRGRSFAKFETRFQIFWVVGAFIPVIIPIPARFGFLMIGVTAGFAAATYWIGRKDAAAGRPPRQGRRIARRPPRSDRDRTEVTPPPDATVVDETVAAFLPPPEPIIPDHAPPPPDPGDVAAPGPDRRPRNPGRRPDTSGASRPPPGATRRRRRPTQRQPRRPPPP